MHRSINLVYGPTLRRWLMVKDASIAHICDSVAETIANRYPLSSFCLVAAGVSGKPCFLFLRSRKKASVAAEQIAEFWIMMTEPGRNDGGARSMRMNGTQ